MSVGVGVDVGAAAVKAVAADASSERAAHTGPRLFTFPELVARVGTRVPHVGRDGDTVITRHAHDLFVQEVREALARLGEPVRDDGAGTAIAVPDWWTNRAHASVREALPEWGLGRASLTSSAVAAVRGYRATTPSVPDTVIVLDLGAHTCSAAVVANCQGDDLHVVGQPHAVHGRGGDDLDARLLHHVLDGLRGQGLTYSPDDPDAVDAGRTLLAECRAAKEALSVRPATTIASHMAGAPAQFRLVRAEHDDIARPAVREIVQVLRDCISAGEHDVDAVLLIGGGAPIPVVAQQISVELGLQVLLAADSSTLAARGAALEALTTAPVKRGSAHRPARLGAWWTRSRARRAATMVAEGRHRGVRAGVAAAYVGIALIVATGSPSSSQADTSNPDPDPSPSVTSLDVGSPTGLLPGIEPRQPLSNPRSAFESGPDLEVPFTQSATLPSEPTATTVPVVKPKKTSSPKTTTDPPPDTRTRTRAGARTRTAAHRIRRGQRH